MGCWVNYHSHTKYCDGTDTPEQYIEEAIRKGLPAYGFSSHGPVNFETEWCIPDPMLQKYISQINSIKERYGDQIEVYLGMEVDFIPGVAGRTRHLLHDLTLDYFIGSVHFVDSFDEGIHWNIDTSFGLFMKGLDKIFNHDFRKAAIRYYEIVRQMIWEDRPHILGHMDKIKMFNGHGDLFDESEKWYTDQVDLTIQVIKECNTIVEINTRGYYRYGQNDLYPGSSIIKKLVKADIPLMINSDAHKPEEITLGMDFAAGELRKAGAREIYALQHGKFRSFTFDKSGINW